MSEALLTNHIQRVPMAYTYTGTSEFYGDIYGNWILCLKTSGTLTFVSLTEPIDIHAVGGGGGGSTGSYANGGGGGYTTTKLKQLPTSSILYCVIGAGGAAATAAGKQASNGGDSYIKLNNSSGTDLIRAAGGKGAINGETKTGGNGGSGGGYYGAIGGSNGSNGEGQHPGTGQGTTTRDFGESRGELRAGGGSGHAKTNSALGGGGNGADADAGISAGAGLDNYGGGGGAGYSGGNKGGSGIIIIRNTRKEQESKYIYNLGTVNYELIPLSSSETAPGSITYNSNNMQIGVSSNTSRHLGLAVKDTINLTSFKTLNIDYTCIDPSSHDGYGYLSIGNYHEYSWYYSIDEDSFQANLQLPISSSRKIVSLDISNIINRWNIMVWEEGKRVNIYRLWLE